MLLPSLESRAVRGFPNFIKTSAGTTLQIARLGDTTRQECNEGGEDVLAIDYEMCVKDEVGECENINAHRPFF